ncbi:Transposase [Moraxella equi]|uniref:Transposase n=1 Tax=Moraxella equi TaxID=60442 RepID=A0A378QW51_9GAMM|nr:Transposase [Moraxella equi]
MTPKQAKKLSDSEFKRYFGIKRATYQHMLSIPTEPKICYNTPMAYSDDFRQQVLRQLNCGKTYRQLAEEYNISTRTILNWKANPDRKVRTSYTSKIDLEKLRQDVLDYPDAYQRERATRFNCTDRAIAKALKRLKLTRKKSD